MSGEGYNEEFKIAAVKQVVEERDILMDAVFFDVESKKNTRS